MFAEKTEVQRGQLEKSRALGEKSRVTFAKGKFLSCPSNTPSDIHGPLGSQTDLLHSRKCLNFSAGAHDTSYFVESTNLAPEWLVYETRLYVERSIYENIPP